MIVAVIRSGRGTILVQWQGNDGHLHRGWIPAQLINADLDISLSVLNEAMPGGLPFEKMFTNISFSAEDLAEALHRRNIWTEEDIARNPNEIAKALLSASSLSVSKIQTIVRDFKPEVS